MNNMAKTYDPKQVEDRIYNEWLEKVVFMQKLTGKRHLIQ